ncbi:EGF-like and EMI domain-containing protein 1 [Octopus sinensis]|uniref:EGF-like and EMI domain-containing protein 1 n=1 Tax=Octopus sinensis TaxID=2607531 RepID=A0A6P7SY50_9MOLL|nr:EGF-like and EMI domain-containing protein 1 [Octopus sinensis]
MSNLFLFIFAGLVLTRNSLTSSETCTNQCNCRTWFGVNACRFSEYLQEKCKCCPGFYISNEYTCEDVNECLKKPAICQQTCINTIGSYHCSCKKGFYLEKDNHTCISKTNCKNMYPQCEHNCTDLKTGPVCSCREGYELSHDEFSCVHKIKCHRSFNFCQHTCVPHHTGYKCKCRKGFKLDPNGYTCTKITHSHRRHHFFRGGHRHVKRPTVQPDYGHHHHYDYDHEENDYYYQ